MLRYWILAFILIGFFCPSNKVIAASKTDVYSSKEYKRLSKLYVDVCKQNEQLRKEVKSLKEVKITAVISDEDRNLLQKAVDNQQKDLRFCKYAVYILGSIALFLFLCLLIRKK